MRSNPFILLIIFAVSIACYTLEYSIGIIICELLIAVVLVKDSIGKKLEDCDLLFFYALFSCIIILGNFMVVYTVGTIWEDNYNYYLSPKYINDAAMISFIGFCSVIMGYSSKMNFFGNFKLTGVISDQLLDKVFIVICLYYAQWYVTAIELPFINYFTYPFLLLQTRVVVLENKPKKMLWVLGLVLLMSVKGILYAYRRQEAFEPFVIFFVAIFIAHRGNWRKLFVFKYIVMMAMVVFMTVQFDSMEKIRNSQGTDRWNEWLKLKDDDDELTVEELFDYNEDQEEEKNILARSSTINQLSQVVGLKEEKGNFNGSTLDYIAYAFIPRFIWPEKPMIMQGRWFAKEIGLAYNHGPDGSLEGINNSINMTVAGELYLNFSYIGVIIGMGFLGILLRSTWEMSNFYDPQNNLPGIILGLFLIAVIYFYIQVDLQFLVNYMQVVLITIVMSTLLNIKRTT